MSWCISGNTDFWRNDLFTRTDPPAPGNNLFGADRDRGDPKENEKALCEALPAWYISLRP
jgi:hypothetical protein